MSNAVSVPRAQGSALKLKCNHCSITLRAWSCGRSPFNLASAALRAVLRRVSAELCFLGILRYAHASRKPVGVPACAHLPRKPRTVPIYIHICTDCGSCLQDLVDVDILACVCRERGKERDTCKYAYIYVCTCGLFAFYVELGSRALTVGSRPTQNA